MGIDSTDTKHADNSDFAFDVPSDVKRDREDVEASPEIDGFDGRDGLPPAQDLEGLTLYEKKALIVNRELESQGMGRYQWMIFFLCGFGYFLDLLWAQAFGLVATPLENELGFPTDQLGNIFTSFSAGLTAGAFVWGVMVDIIGRRWAFNFTVLCTSVFGLCLGAPSSYNAILVLTAFVGFGIGGNIPIDTTICLEFLPMDKRWLLPTLSIFQPLGVVICSAIAYGFIPFHSCAADAKPCNQVPAGQFCCTKSSNYGWRYLLFTLGAITMLVFFLRFVVFNFQESPKYLLYKGQDEEAIKVLQHVAKVNRCQCNVTLATFAALTSDASSADTQDSSKPLILGSRRQKGLGLGPILRLEFERFKILFSSWSMISLVILLWIIYAFDYWGFTIAGSFLPTILNKKNSAAGISIKETYLSYIYIYIFGIPGVLAGTLIYRARRLSLFISSALFGAMLFTFTTVDTEAKRIGINGLVYFFQSMFNAILYGWTPEAFPAPIRGTAAGVASFWGRIFSIISPLIAAHVLANDPSGNNVLYLAGGPVFICSICVLLIPGKYMGTQSY